MRTRAFHTVSLRGAALVALVAVSSSACSGGDAECASDADCVGEQVCSVARVCEDVPVVVIGEEDMRAPAPEVDMPDDVSDMRDAPDLDEPPKPNSTTLDTFAVIRVPSSLELRAAPGESTSEIIAIENRGTGSLSLGAVSIEPDGALTISWPDPASTDDPSADTMSPPDDEVEPGGRALLRVTYAPSGTEASDAVIAIDTNDPTTPRATVSVTGRPPHCLELTVGDDALAEFGSVKVGETFEMQVVLENCSAEQQTVSRFELLDPNSPFTLSSLNAVPFTLPVAGSVTASLEFAPLMPVNASTQLVAETENALATVDVVGDGTDLDCPVALATASVIGGDGMMATTLDVVPLQTIQLDASASTSRAGGAPAVYNWSLVSKPRDSAAVLDVTEDPARPGLFVDVAGDYVIELELEERDGTVSCEPARITISATPNESIYVELTWDTPGDPDQSDMTGSDLDLHYLDLQEGRQFGDHPYDCYWNNKTPDWGVLGDDSDDPSFDRDDLDGLGPESVTHNNPAGSVVDPLLYAVGVDYYDDRDFGASSASLKIFVDGQIKLDLRDKSLAEDGLFWLVGGISWPSKEVTITDTVSDSML